MHLLVDHLLYISIFPSKLTPQAFKTDFFDVAFNLHGKNNCDCSGSPDVVLLYSRYQRSHTFVASEGTWVLAAAGLMDNGPMIE